MAKRPRHARGSERGGKWWRTLLAGSARVVCQEMLTSMRVSHFHHRHQATRGSSPRASGQQSPKPSAHRSQMRAIGLVVYPCPHEHCWHFAKSAAQMPATAVRRTYLQAMLGLPAQHRPRTRVAEAAVDGRVEVEDLRPRGQPLQGYLQRRADPKRAVCAQDTPQDTPQNSALTRCSCCTL